MDTKYETLFQELESQFTKTKFADKWSLLAMATLVASRDPDHAHNLYLYLIQKTDEDDHESRRLIVRRLREALVKTVPLVGVCKPIEAILSIAAVERPEDRDSQTTTREGWQCDKANEARGVRWFERLYQGNADDTLQLFEAHRDFAWLSTNITYGLFLGDRAVLDDLETEIIVLAAIMSQDLKTETHWHIRGLRRLGVSSHDAKVVWDCVQQVAGFYGSRLDRVPTVDDVVDV